MESDVVAGLLPPAGAVAAAFGLMRPAGTRVVRTGTAVVGDGRVVKLTITHESDRPESKTIKNVSSFWPLIASNLKSLLETGEVPITEWR